MTSNNNTRPIQALGLWHVAFNMVFILLLNNYNIYGPFDFTHNDYDTWQLVFILVLNNAFIYK
jgi:hypothetical protein